MELVCPGCRTRTSERIDVRTLDRAGDGLVCECGRRYPVIDGLPIVLADAGEYLRREAMAVVERDLPPETAALLARDGGDDAPYARMLEHLSIYLDAHWGDRAEPVGELGIAAIVEKIRALARVESVVELGCSVGRAVAELAQRADHVVGIELGFASARRAKKLLAGERLPYCRRMVGRHYGTAIATGEAVGHATIVCGDALDPPLVPQAFDRVVALNLLDSVPHPRRLLAVADGLLARGGELIVTSPFAWQSTTMADHERIGEADPVAALAALLDGYRIEDTAELPWTLRRDARSVLTYRVHYLRARKL